MNEKMECEDYINNQRMTILYYRFYLNTICKLCKKTVESKIISLC